MQITNSKIKNHPHKQRLFCYETSPGLETSIYCYCICDPASLLYLLQLLAISHGLERQTVCSTVQSMSLCVNGVQVWNYLCDDLKMVDTVAAFKRKCKNLLFKKYLVMDHLP